MNEKSEDMDEKSTRNSGKVNDVEGDMIERSIQMKEEAKTKIHEKAHSLRKAHFEKARSKINRKLRVKNLCCNIFVVFLKCTLEKGLGGFQQIIHFSTQSSMMWNFLMAKSKSMQPTLLLKIC